MLQIGDQVAQILITHGRVVKHQDFAATLWHCRSALRHREKVLAQLVLIGTQTLGITALVSLFVGMVMVVQAADQLQNFTQEILGSLVGLAMTKELGPVVVGFLVAGKSGSAIAAEIGSMKVYDEISALRTMDVGVSCDPINEYNDHCTMNKVLEYMAFGKAQVMFDLKEGRASAGDAAVYVRGNSAEDLAQAIGSLLDDPSRRQAMGRRGAQRIQQELNWERSVEQLLKAYETALQ